MSTARRTAPLPKLLLTAQRADFWDAAPGAGHTPARLAKVAPHKPLKVLDTQGPAGYVRVLLEGAIEVRGLVRLQDLGVQVCQPGPLGVRGYAGAGNVLGLAGPMDEDTVDIADHALVTARPWRDGMQYVEQFQRVPVTGKLGRERLCQAPPPPRHAGTDADPFVGHAWGEVDLEDFATDAQYVDIAPGVTLTLLDAPDGQGWLTRPAEQYGFVVVRVAQKRTATGLWDQVALGGGPYVVGWTPSRPGRAESEGGLAMLGGILGGTSPVPFLLVSANLQKLPLHTLPAGTVVQQYGAPFAVLKKPGWARAGDVRDGWRYVFVAVDGDALVEGWVRPDVLQPAPVETPAK